jgi:hypothetical protein
MELITASKENQQRYEQVLAHPVYAHIDSLENLHVFMEFHVFAVWDFMMLLKSLQTQFTSLSVPWIPPTDPVVCRMINEIVLAEESDCFENGIIQSHFEFYIDAMKVMGANTVPILTLIDSIRSGVPFETAIQNSLIPEVAQRFVMHTHALVVSQQWHEIAAVFAYAREGLIPSMFTEIVAVLAIQFPNQLHRFSEYLSRHIELDGDTHGPLAKSMVDRLCGDDPIKAETAMIAVGSALQSRLELWDGVLAQITCR